MDIQKFMTELQVNSNKDSLGSYIKNYFQNASSSKEVWEKYNGHMNTVVQQAISHDDMLTTHKLCLSRNDVFVDVGCYNGSFIKIAMDYVKNAVGIDKEQRWLDEAKADKYLEGIEFLLCEANNINLPDSFATKTLAAYVFPLFETQEYLNKAFSELIRITKNDGLVLIKGLLSAGSKMRKNLTIENYEALVKKHKINQFWFLGNKDGEYAELLFKVRK